MSIEFSIEVWPWVSLLCWFLAWALLTCIGCGGIAMCYEAAKKRNWAWLSALIFVTCYFWFMQWLLGLMVNVWLGIIFG